MHLLVLGGHTTEMLRLLGSLSSMYHPRIYIVAQTDKMSTEKITSFENEKKKQQRKSDNSEVSGLLLECC